MSMKWLIVMYVSEDGMTEEQQRQYRELQYVCGENHAEAVSCFYIDPVFPDEAAKQIGRIFEQEECQGMLAAESGLCAEVLGLAAAKLGLACLTGVNRIRRESKGPIFHKPVYGCNVDASFRLPIPFAVSLSTLKRDKEQDPDRLPGIQKEIMLPAAAQPEYIRNRHLIKAGVKQEGRGVLLAAGKGIRTKEEIDKIRCLAREKGYLFGVSRPVAMNGWAGIDEIIGVSGHIYAPQICITMGVSGSAAFYAGIENSGWIASVNTDRKAPIVRMSDVSVIDDYANVWGHLSSFI